MEFQCRKVFSGHGIHTKRKPVTMDLIQNLSADYYQRLKIDRHVNISYFSRGRKTVASIGALYHRIDTAKRELFMRSFPAYNKHKRVVIKILCRLV